MAPKSLYTGSVCSQAGPPTVIRTAPAAASSVEVPPQEYTLLIYRKFCVPQNGHLTGLRSAAIRLGCHEEGGVFVDRFNSARPKINLSRGRAGEAEDSGGRRIMSSTEGRIEKRLRLSVPLELSKLQDPSGADRTVTENVCSVGARVLTRRAVEPNERLMVRFLEVNLQTEARVVYCQRLPDGRFCLGLHFQGMLMSKWTAESFGGAYESS